MELDSNRIMVFGTFDVLHKGHKFFIEESIKKAQSSKFKIQKEKISLVIVVARDKTVKKLKPLLRNSEQIRMKALQEAFPEVTVVLGDEEDYMLPVKEFKPVLVCLGYDQDSFNEQLMREHPEIELIRIESYKPEIYKSSKM